MALPWDKLDVVTWSWQKVLGGEAAHGMLALSPRAVERLLTYKPAWPLPKIFRLTSGGKLIEGIFKGETINTPVDALRRGCAGRAALGRERRRPGRADRAQRGQSRRDRRLGRAHATGSTSWPRIAATRSCTSICLKITAPWFTALAPDAQAAAAKRIAALLEKEGVAYDIGAYRDAPPGLRIWGGATVETADIAALLPWLDWAYATVDAERERRFARLRQRSERAMPKVLISDKLSPAAVEIFRDRGIDVDLKPGLTPAELRAIIARL